MAPLAVTVGLAAIGLFVAFIVRGGTLRPTPQPDNTEGGDEQGGAL